MNGISTKTAQNVATAFEGNRKQLVKALRQDLGEAKGAKRVRSRGLRTGLTNRQMQNVLGELERSGKKMQRIAAIGSHEKLRLMIFLLDANFAGPREDSCP